MDIVAAHARTAASALRKIDSVYANWVDQCSDAHEENYKLNFQVEKLQYALASTEKESERLREALKKIAYLGHYDESGCWNSDSYPDEIAAEALKGDE